MTSDEAEDYRRHLTALLDKHHIGWIADEADEAIVVGKTISKRIQPQQIVATDFETRPRSARRRTEEFLATEPFDPTEKLRILLDAIEHALFAPARMESEIINNLKLDAGEVQFMAEDSAQPLIHFSAGQLDRTNRSATELRVAVERIRELL